VTISNKVSEIRQAFLEGSLEAESVSPEGEVSWQPVLASFQTKGSTLPLYEVSTQQGSMRLTGNHRVFLSPREKLPAGFLEPGQEVLSIKEGSASSLLVEGVRQIPSEDWVYDITVGENHNFKVLGSGVVVSNSPDRTYRFRPPQGEGDIGCNNQVFGYIWTDEEFAEFLEIAVWKWNLHPPNTDCLYPTVDAMCQKRPAYKSALLWGSLVTAAQMLAYRWTVNEFDYSIGGISLNIDKSSKYMDLKRNAEEQWDKLTTAKQQTEKYLRGLQQPRFGRGVRSAFGPAVGRGVLSPRNFVVWFMSLPGVYWVWEVVLHASQMPSLLS
jgi:hypothetical protein